MYVGEGREGGKTYPCGSEIRICVVWECCIVVLVVMIVTVVTVETVEITVIVAIYNYLFDDPLVRCELTAGGAKQGAWP